ncbi:MAG: hypothetical protein ACYC9J_11105 [Sulfuricaulis sp.]
MKILLAANKRETAALFQALARVNDHEITYCADGARAITALLKNGYDWAIIGGHCVTGGDTDIARLIRTIGSEIPGIVDRSVLTAAGADQPVMHTSCGVEWSQDGILQLHCGLHTLMKAGGAAPHPGMGCAGEILFEYHAPCSNGRRRNGC